MMAFFEQEISTRISSVRPEEVEIMLEPNHARVITIYNGDELASATEPIFKETIDGDLRYYINHFIQAPFDDLLIYLKIELQGKENEELQAWRVRMLP